MPSRSGQSIVRRKLLKVGAAALLAGSASKAQQTGSPAVVTGTQAGRKFRAWLGNAAKGGVEELELLPIQDRHVLVRTEASAPCYTLVLGGLGGTPSVPPQPTNAAAPPP